MMTEIHWLTNASGTAAAYNASDSLAFLSLPSADANRECGPCSDTMAA